jgi:hypothetical protein
MYISFDWNKQYMQLHASYQNIFKKIKHEKNLRRDIVQCYVVAIMFNGTIFSEHEIV